MSAAEGGSQGLGKGTPVQLLVFIVFALGVLLAAIALYQQTIATQKPYTISKEEAVRIALVEVDKEPTRDAAYFPKEDTLARLLHVNEAGVAFITDEGSLADMALYSTDHKFKEIYSNGYVWQVAVSTTDDAGGSRGYWYLVDGSNGKIIGTSNDYAAFDISR